MASSPQDGGFPCNFALVFHGAIVLLLAQFAGYVFARVLARSPDDAIKAGMWRMSHSASSVGAVLLVALAPVVPHLHLARSWSAFLVGALVASTYALSLGTVIAGASGHRGMKRGGPWSNLLVYVLYVAGAVGSTAAGVVLLVGAAGAYLPP